MNTVKIIISGYGGQGILTLGQLIADIAMAQGKEVTWMPSYGAEMRGGTANCSVIISEKPIGNPMVRGNIDILCALSIPSVAKFLNQVRPNGTAILNTSIITEIPKKDDINIISIDAANIAQKAGSARAVNMAMLAGFLPPKSQTTLFTLDEIEAALIRRFEGSKELVEINMKAIKSTS
jgi:2-oxoglutarate ferredoxin oxidoreductase subunit gamma